MYLQKKTSNVSRRKRKIKKNKHCNMLALKYVFFFGGTSLAIIKFNSGKTSILMKQELIFLKNSLECGNKSWYSTLYLLNFEDANETNPKQ